MNEQKPAVVIVSDTPIVVRQHSEVIEIDVSQESRHTKPTAIQAILFGVFVGAIIWLLLILGFGIR